MKWFLNFFAIFIFCSAAFGQSLRKKIKQHVKDEEFKYIEAYNKFEESFAVTNREICGKVRNLLNETLEQSMEIFERIGERNARQNFLTFNSTMIGNLSYFLDTIEEELDTKSVRKDFKAGFLITDTLFSRMAFEDYPCIKRFGDDIRNFSSVNYQRISQCLRIPVVKVQYFRRMALITVQQIKDGISGIFQKLRDCKDREGRFNYNCLSNIFWNSKQNWIKPIFSSINLIPQEFERMLEPSFLCVFNFMKDIFISNSHDLEVKLNSC